MNPRKITIKELEKNGFVLKRHGANHDVYFNHVTHQTIPGELLRLIEVGASCFNHYCVGYDIRNHTSYTMSTGV